MNDKITTEIYQQDPSRFSVVSGHQSGAPTCPAGNILQWVGYDKKEDKYVRFTKSVFKKLVAQAEMK